LAQERTNQPQERGGESGTETRRDKKKLNDQAKEIQSGELCVFIEDECHLLWGDTLGYVWGRRNEAVEVPILNQRQRQTYYGAIDLYRKEFIVQPYERANGHNTVAFLKHLQQQREGKRLLLLWDKASYHRYAEMKAYLQEINQGLDENHWKVTCLLFESNAPEQNPVEDIWLKAKNFLRQHFYENKTFHQVKSCFFNFLNNHIFDLHKLTWYFNANQIPQLI
jgi:transposase